MRRLRIFYASGESPGGSLLPTSTLWRRNLHASLVQMGHDVVDFYYDRLEQTFDLVDPNVPGAAEFIAWNRPRLSEALLRQVVAAHRERPIDVLFTYFYSACVTPDTIREIGSLGIKTVNWFCNGGHQFYLIEELAPAYDLSLVPEVYRLEDYRRVGARPLYVQEAANPRYYSPAPHPEDHGVVFVGQRYGERPRLMGRLFQAGLPIQVFGPGWVRQPSLRAWAKTLLGRAAAAEVELPGALCHHPVSDDELPRLFARARVTLGFGACGDPDVIGERITQIRLRDFEAPMSGAAYLTEYSDEYARFYEPDVEVAMYHTPDEMIEKAKRLLADHDWRRSLRRNGRARSLREHTWEHRFADVFRALGLDE